MQNMFWFERVLRAPLGAIIAALGFAMGYPFLFVVGGALFVTGLLGWCPVMAAVGINEK